MANSEDEDLLKQLNAHGASFMSNFSLPESSSYGLRTKKSVPLLDQQDSSDEDEEWGGIGTNEGEEGSVSGE